MGKIKKKEIKKRILKIGKICLIIFLILSIYSIGRARGIIDGAYIAGEKYNFTICDFLNKERDVDGFCILTEKESKYRWYKDCGYEKFKINGDKKVPFLINKIEDIKEIFFYPVVGC